MWCPDALLHAQMPYRALFIVRDPRSELAEQWMAGRRRGVLPAVLTHVDTPLSFAERQATHAVRTSLLRLAELQPGATQLCIRYEDLIGQTAEVWARLRSWLQLESRPAPPPPGTGDEWPANRWRQCLPDSVSALYDQRMRGEMEAHGYAI